MGIGLTAAELAQIRNDIAQLFPDTCHILSLTLTSDGMGGNTETWGTAGTAIPCRLDFTARGRETVSSDKNTPFQTGVVSMAYNQSVTTANRLQFGAVAYNVTSTNTDQSWIGVKRMSVERVP